jgi:teichuronic acid biosynthesis glycosyltransferase TuaC
MGRAVKSTRRYLCRNAFDSDWQPSSVPIASKMIAHIGIIADYPSPVSPYRGVFVRNLAIAIRRYVEACTVIAPMGIHRMWDECRKARTASWRRRSEDGLVVTHPIYWSIGYKGRSRARVTQLQFNLAVRRAAASLELDPDLWYGHFLYASGEAAVLLGQKSTKPSFLSIGEGGMINDVLTYVDWFGMNRVKKLFERTAGVITVSKTISKQLQDSGFAHEDMVGVFPNGVDLETFHPSPREAARAVLGMDQKEFLIVYVGSLSERKGADRLARAIEGLPGVSALFLGPGSLSVSCENAARIGPVPHAEMPKYLVAADVFVLPTLSEGCCNALLEAQACGLPVITSHGEFNDDIVSEDTSLRVDPLSIDEIRQAILTLRNNVELRIRMGDAAARWALQFDINLRARRVLDFMEAQCQAWMDRRMQGNAGHS